MLNIVVSLTDNSRSVIDDYSIFIILNKSSQVKSSQDKSSQVKSSQVKSSQVKSSQVKSSQVKSSQVKSSQVWKTSELFEHKSWAPETVGK